MKRTSDVNREGAGILDAREAVFKARELFLKIGDADDAAARQAAAEFRVLMDQWGVTLENMRRFAKEDWRPIASNAITFWRESREASRLIDPNYRRPKREREAWSLWQEIADALEMIAALNLGEPSEDDTYDRKVFERSSKQLKRLVESGKYPKDLNDERDFQRWHAEWDCW